MATIKDTRRNARNAEGYLDPTAYVAIKNTEGYSTFDPHLYQYAKDKLKMLVGEFLVVPTSKEVDTLFGLNNEVAIDRYAVKIIADHWKKE